MSAWLLEYGHAGRYSYGNSLVIRTNNSPVVPDENRDSPERDMVNPSTYSYMWPIGPIRDTH